jgi:hypothetical protein
MTLPNQDFSSQLKSLQQQLASLQTHTPAVAYPQPQPVVHKISMTEGMAGAEAILKELPPGASDIVAHKSEDIVYIIARDDNGVPAPIRVAKLTFIEAQDDPTGYVTKKDFDAFKDELRAMFAQKGAEA